MKLQNFSPRHDLVLLKITFEGSALAINGSGKSTNGMKVLDREIIKIGDAVKSELLAGDLVLLHDAPMTMIPIDFEDNEISKDNIVKQIKADSGESKAFIKKYITAMYVLVQDRDIIAVIKPEIKNANLSNVVYFGNSNNTITVTKFD